MVSEETVFIVIAWCGVLGATCCWISYYAGHKKGWRQGLERGHKEGYLHGRDDYARGKQP